MQQRPHEILIVVLSIMLFVTGCGERASEDTTETSSTSTHPTVEQLANAAYTGIYDQPVQLADGRFQGEPFQPGGASRPVVKLVKELYAVGDLSGDEVDEAAVILAENSGGSGTQIYVAAVAIIDGKPVNVGTARLGDRTQIRGLAIADQRILVDVVEHGPNDPACCPSHLATRSWVWRRGKFADTGSKMTGTLSLAALADTEWVLSRFSNEEPAPPEPKLTVVFEADRITGSAGCNRFFAGIEESSPGDVRIAQVGSTRMACSDDIMRLEKQYLECIERVNRYSFLTGTLILRWQSDDEAGALFFTPASLPTE